MHECLSAAGWRAGEVELVKLQAAGSPGSDLAEARALTRVFGDALPPLLSLKPWIGHTLGASGVAELSALLALLDADRLPATPSGVPDDEISAKFPVDRSNVRIDRALLNLIGFGGGLASVALERVA
jgi:3-oxoacyl-[acyl-carrier-protein] synthase-1